MHAQAWDMAAEMCLLQLPALLSGEPDAQFLPSPFFAEQLTAFELWLAHGSSLKQPPEQLPIVLQASVCCALDSQKGPARWEHAGQSSVMHCLTQPAHDVVWSDVIIINVQAPG